MALDLLHKSHSAPVSYPTMHRFVEEMCTCVHISLTKWCIVGYYTAALWNFFDRSSQLKGNDAYWHFYIFACLRIWEIKTSSNERMIFLLFQLRVSSEIDYVLVVNLQISAQHYILIRL